MRSVEGAWRVLSGGWQVAFALHAGAGASWYDASALMRMPDLAAVSGSSSAGGGQQNAECGCDGQVLEQHECGEGSAGVWAVEEGGWEGRQDGMLSSGVCVCVQGGRCGYCRKVGSVLG